MGNASSCMCYIWNHCHQLCDQKPSTNTLQTTFYITGMYHWTKIGWHIANLSYPALIPYGHIHQTSVHIYVETQLTVTSISNVFAVCSRKKIWLPHYKYIWHHFEGHVWECIWTYAQPYDQKDFKYTHKLNLFHFHVPLNMYGWHIANIANIALILSGHIDQTMS